MEFGVKIVINRANLCEFEFPVLKLKVMLKKIEIKKKTRIFYFV